MTAVSFLYCCYRINWQDDNERVGLFLILLQETLVGCIQKRYQSLVTGDRSHFSTASSLPVGIVHAIREIIPFPDDRVIQESHELSSTSIC